MCGSAAMAGLSQTSLGASPMSLRPSALPHALPACISLAAEMGPREHWAVGCGGIAGVSCNPEPLLQC